MEEKLSGRDLLLRIFRRTDYRSKGNHGCAGAEFSVTKRVNSEFFKGNQLNLSRALINILSNAARYSSGHKK